MSRTGVTIESFVLGLVRDQNTPQFLRDAYRNEFGIVGQREQIALDLIDTVKDASKPNAAREQALRQLLESYKGEL